MKKTAQRIQDFQKIPTIKDIPAPLWLRVRDALAETIYPEHAHAWGEFIYAFDGVLEVSIEQIHYLTPPPYGICYRHICSTVALIEMMSLTVRCMSMNLCVSRCHNKRVFY